MSITIAKHRYSSVLLGLTLLAAGCANSRTQAIKTLDAQVAQRIAAKEESGRLYQEAASAHENGQRDAALEGAQAAVKKNKQNAEAWMLLGTLHYEQARLFDAIVAFEQAARLRPLRHEARFNMGVVLEQAGRYEQAIKEYELALARAPGNITIMENLVRCYVKSGKGLERAKQLIETALKTERRPEWIKWLQENLQTSNCE